MLFMASRPDKKNSKAHKVFVNSPYYCNYNDLFNIIKLMLLWIYIISGAPRAREGRTRGRSPIAK